MLYRICLLTTAAASMMACVGSGENPVDQPPDITFDTAAVAFTADRLAESRTIERNQDVALTGSANYSGAFLADLEVDFEPGQSIVGQIDMVVDFNARNGDAPNVGGTMSNFGIADENGVATEGILGTIPLSGTMGEVAVTDKPEGVPGSGSPGDTRVAQNILQVSGEGTLTGTFGQDQAASVPIDLDMIGHARTRFVPGTSFPGRLEREDWISGVIGGDGQGDYDIFFEGRFYLIED